MSQYQHTTSPTRNPVPQTVKELVESDNKKRSKKMPSYNLSVFLKIRPTDPWVGNYWRPENKKTAREARRRRTSRALKRMKKHRERMQNLLEDLDKDLPTFECEFNHASLEVEPEINFDIDAVHVNVDVGLEFIARTIPLPEDLNEGELEWETEFSVEVLEDQDD